MELNTEMLNNVYEYVTGKYASNVEIFNMNSTSPTPKNTRLTVF